LNPDLSEKERKRKILGEGKKTTLISKGKFYVEAPKKKRILRWELSSWEGIIVALVDRGDFPGRPERGKTVKKKKRLPYHTKKRPCPLSGIRKTSSANEGG